MSSGTSPGSSTAGQGWLGGLTAKIAGITALLVAFGGLLDIAISLFSKTEPAMCILFSSLPGCAKPPPIIPAPSSNLPSPPAPTQPSSNPPLPPPLPVPSTPSFTPPAAFSVIVQLSTGPGTPQRPSSRNWKLVSANKWVESYIDGSGKQFSYDAIGRFTLLGCPGTELREESQPPHYIFVTDIGCVGSPIYTSSDGQHWGNIGVMTDMQ